MVLLIMGIVMGLVTANIAGQRAQRNLKLAQSQMVSKIREIQSSALYSRNVAYNTPAEYYLLKFDLNNPTEYVVQAVYNVTSPPVRLITIETIKLPQDVRIGAYSSVACLSSGVCIQRPAGFTSQTPSSCALLAFKVPYGKIIYNENCVSNGFANNTDDYAQITQYVGNDTGGGSATAASGDSVMTIRLTNKSGSLYKTITVNGLSGAITFQ